MFPIRFVKRFAPIVLIFVALLSANTAYSADTDDLINKLHALKVGETTQAQAVRSLGEPQKRQTTLDGGSVLLTYEKNSEAADDNGLGGITTLAGMASWLMPTQMGMVTQEVAGAVGAGNSLLSSGQSSAPSDSDAVIILFDREGRFVFWVGTVGGKKVSSHALGYVPKMVFQQPTLAQAPAPVADGKARLGMEFALLSAITEEGPRAALDAGGITGLYIRAVFPGSTAEQAGLRPHDIVYMIDGTLIVSMEDLRRTLNRLRQGDTVWLGVMKVNDQSTKWTRQDVKVSF